MNIILRTVCGCERIKDLEDRYLPPMVKVPYFTWPYTHWCGFDDSDLTVPVYAIRVFTRIPVVGQYGYPVYLEQL